MRRIATTAILLLALAAMPASSAAFSHTQVQPAGGPHAYLAAHTLSAALGPCLAAHPRARISVGIRVARGLQFSWPFGRDAWGGVQILHVTLTAVVLPPDRVPQAIETSTTVISGWIHTRAGTIDLEAAVGPQAAIYLATAAAPRVATALGCPPPPGTTPAAPQNTPPPTDDRP
jgi:hypothetical protein